MFGIRAARSTVLVALSTASILVAALPSAASAAVTLTVVATGFDRPLYVTNAGDSRLFVVEQGGLIWVVQGGTKSVFADLTSRVAQTGSERGLLGLAFHPNYASNRLFYVNFTRASDGATVVAELRRSSGNANAADPNYFRRVLLVSQPATNHNGGWMDFRGNLLYIAMGDGGGSPGSRPQSLSTLLGKILRINPLDPPGSRTYTIPSSNPYVGRTGRDEIWARGLRNPWRCSFDRAVDKLWCADVGQNTWEEVNKVVATRGGLNYGWAVMEGRHCYNPPSGCNRSGKKLPLVEYSHGSFGGGNCSVTGGYVSRRPGAALYGRYIFGDFCSGNVWTIPAGHPAGSPLPTPTDTDRMITSFGEGFDKRIYLVHRGSSSSPNSGVVYYVDGT